MLMCLELRLAITTAITLSFSLKFLTQLLNPHFFDAGEEGGGFETEGFGSAAETIDFPFGVL